MLNTHYYYEIWVLIIPILQMRKLRPGERLRSNKNGKEGIDTFGELENKTKHQYSLLVDNKSVQKYQNQLKKFKVWVARGIKITLTTNIKLKKGLKKLNSSDEGKWAKRQKRVIPSQVNICIY